MKLENFAKLLKSHYVPSYAFPRIEPSDIWNYYKPGRVVKERNVDGIENKKTLLVLDSKSQTSIWSSLLKIKSFGSTNLVISSEVNDYLAHQVATLLNLQWLRKFHDLEFRWTTPNFKYERIDTKAQVVFIRSVLPIQEKLYCIRDIFDKHPNAVKVLILGGMNGIEFFDDYLKMPLHGALHIEGTYESLPNKFYKNTIAEQDALVPPFVLSLDKIPELNVRKKG